MFEISDSYGSSVLLGTDALGQYQVVDTGLGKTLSVVKYSNQPHSIPFWNKSGWQQRYWRDRIWHAAKHASHAREYVHTQRRLVISVAYAKGKLDFPMDGETVVRDYEPFFVGETRDRNPRIHVVDGERQPTLKPEAVERLALLYQQTGRALPKFLAPHPYDQVMIERRTRGLPSHPDDTQERKKQTGGYYAYAKRRRQRTRQRAKAWRKWWDENWSTVWRILNKIGAALLKLIPVVGGAIGAVAEFGIEAAIDATEVFYNKLQAEKNQGKAILRAFESYMETAPDGIEGILWRIQTKYMLPPNYFPGCTPPDPAMNACYLPLPVEIETRVKQLVARPDFQRLMQLETEIAQLPEGGAEAAIKEAEIEQLQATLVPLGMEIEKELDALFWKTFPPLQKLRVEAKQTGWEKKIHIRVSQLLDIWVQWHGDIVDAPEGTLPGVWYLLSPTDADVIMQYQLSKLEGTPPPEPREKRPCRSDWYYVQEVPIGTVSQATRRGGADTPFTKVTELRFFYKQPHGKPIPDRIVQNDILGCNGQFHWCWKTNAQVWVPRPDEAAAKRQRARMLALNEVVENVEKSKINVGWVEATIKQIERDKKQAGLPPLFYECGPIPPNLGADEGPAKAAIRDLKHHLNNEITRLGLSRFQPFDLSTTNALSGVYTPETERVLKAVLRARGQNDKIVPTDLQTRMAAWGYGVAKAAQWFQGIQFWKRLYREAYSGEMGSLVNDRGQFAYYWARADKWRGEGVWPGHAKQVFQPDDYALDVRRYLDELRLEPDPKRRKEIRAMWPGDLVVEKFQMKQPTLRVLPSAIVKIPPPPPIPSATMPSEELVPRLGADGMYETKPPRRGLPAWAWALIGVGGVAALGVGGYFISQAVAGPGQEGEAT